MTDLRHRLTQAAADDGVPLHTDMSDLLKRARGDRRRYRARVSLGAAATTAVVLVGGGLTFQALAPDDSTAPDPAPAQAPPSSAAAEPRQDESWVLPLDNYRITNTFGASQSYYSSGYHTGLDFAAALGTPIKAVAGGVITEAKYAGAYGNKTVITLEDGTELWFGQQSAFEADEGDEVQAGDVIGYVGSTGNSFGAHVHLEVRPGGGDPVDPAVALAEHGVDADLNPRDRPNPSEATSDAAEPPVEEPAEEPAEESAEESGARWVRPVDGCRITEVFGTKSDYDSSAFHTGLDFVCRRDNAPIKAVARGTITQAAYDGAYGNKAVITLEDGTELWFAHLSKFAVEVGDKVRAGQVIGNVGETGNAARQHLHLEVRPGGGDPVDPASALAEHGVEFD